MVMTCADPQIEQMTLDDLHRYQLEHLQKTVRWAYDKSQFYREKFAEQGVPEIGSLSDVEKLPFTTLADILQHSPYDFLAMPLSGILRMTQQMVPMKITKMYSADDVAHNIEMMTRVLAAADINRTSVVGVLGDLSESRILDIQYALEMLGATVVPLGITIEQVISLLELSGADTLIGSAEELMQLIIQTQIRARDIVDYPLKKVLSLNESIQNPMHRHFEERMQVKIHDLFSSEELGFAGLLYECGAGKGAHLQEDNYYAEVVEFGNAQPITEDGKMGELVLTTLQVQAMPLLRYRTGQAVMRLAEPCACGRTFMRFITPFGGI